eukprot:3237319-Rhodomonas_salina.1
MEQEYVFMKDSSSSGSLADKALAQQRQERACIAHYLCGGCPYASPFQKEPPSAVEHCPRFRATLRKHDVNDTGELCINRFFCDPTSPLQRALEQGHFEVPDTINRLWVDGGADWGTFTSRCKEWKLEWNGKCTAKEFSTSSDVLALAIDANTAYHRKLRALPRVLAVPSALGDHNGVLVFRHFSIAGCSSASEPNIPIHTTIKGVPKGCQSVRRREAMPLLRLELLLGMMPSRLRLELVKIDVQGQDLLVTKSLGCHLRHVEKVFVELQDETAPSLYKIQGSRQEAEQWMVEHGFVVNTTVTAPQNADIGEWNVLFEHAQPRRVMQ